MPFCKKCGLELEADAVFCPECGTPRSTTAKSKPTGSESTQTEPEDSGKTMLRQQPVYGIVNLENLPAGHVIDERYEIKEKLGQGGFGAVYRAYDKKLEIDKALKVIPEAVVNDLEAMERLRAEARTMIRLNHENIVRVYDFHDSGQVKFIDMEFVAGKSLTQLKLQQPEKRLPEQEVKKYAVQIAAGLAYAHSQGVIHRDVKPQNILLGPDGKVKIMDFGIAETLRSSMSRIANSSSSGTLVYMSPEQLRGKEVGKESDIYSFGVTLYELLSGHPPFWRGDINYQILHEVPAEIDGISEGLWSCLEASLRKEYRARPGSFTEVLALLVEAPETRPTVSRIAPMINRRSPERIEMDFVEVEGGTFEMGNANGSWFRGTSDEKPVHAVTLSSFKMSKYPVTVGQFELFCQASNQEMPEQPSWNGSDHPVVNVNWHEAAAFCAWLSEVIEGAVRLPTEAEWEYAARGGKKSKGHEYSGSNRAGEVAWYWDNSAKRTHSVGRKQPNELGLYDLSGNVWEWCWDWYGSGFYKHSPRNNPKGPDSGNWRVLRGGSWDNFTDLVRSAYRNWDDPVSWGYFKGFRCVRNVL